MNIILSQRKKFIGFGIQCLFGAEIIIVLPTYARFYPLEIHVHIMSRPSIYLQMYFFYPVFCIFLLQSLACVDKIRWFQLRIMYSGYIQWEHDQLGILIAVVVKLM